jgi:galactan 5-O-arabinofuranosyltransferase
MSTITEEIPRVSEPAAPALLSELDTPDTLVRRGFGRVLGELAAAAVVAVVVSLGVQFVVSRWHVPMPSYAPQSLISLLCAVAVLAALWLAVRSRFGVLGKLISWAGLSALCSGVLSFMLVGTRFYLAGIAGDNLFRTEYLTRFTDSAAFNDFAYQGLPGYYPRGWFWVAGRLAALAHIQGWEIYKPYAIASMALGTVLTYVAWCLVLRPAAALLVSLAVSTVALTTFAANEPYAWVFGALIPPLAAVGWHYLTDRAARPGWQPAVLLGVFVGLLGLFYTLLLGFFVLTLVATGLVAVLLAVRGGERWQPAVRRALTRLVAIGLVSVPLLALQWVPYLATSLGATGKQSGAMNYLPQSGALFPVFNYPTGFAGALCLIGLVWGLLRLRDNVVARALMLVTGCGYAWYALSFASTVAHLTLLPFKIDLVMDETLRCAGVLGVIDGVRLLWRWLSRRARTQAWRGYAVLVVAVLAVVGMVGELQSGNGSLSELVNDAYSGYYPDGATALGQHDPKQDGAYNQQLHDTIARLTGQPEHDLVVLSTYQDFVAYYPYWNFQTTVLEYANPLAEFDQRNAEIQSWARADSPAALLTDLRTSRFGAPTVFVLRTKPDGLHLTLSRNVFPAAADNVGYDVVFPARLFDSTAFTSSTVGPFTVVVRH